ncbi:polymeric immunoglobulin receptor-like [Denticeps clupeoides]|uniref:polymeric immunoglobulin receptor-like n=1 Tax=Denticeps clupeoides TaxID=299321 RepID=UPI0010A47354|nr:polymeric immunoglobulin receptor-like [Denticeps clupeoides]
MKDLLIFTLYISSGGVAAFSVKGYSGAAVVMNWDYKSQYKDAAKCFCKSEDTGGCRVVGNTTAENLSMTYGRFSLLDNATIGVFSVLITPLAAQDSGTYLCLYNPEYMEVHLIVKTDAYFGRSVSIPGYLHGNVEISCEYPAEHKHSVKVLSSPAGIFVSSLTPEDREWGKFSLTDNRQDRVFTVTIGQLDMADSGIYWCGVETQEPSAWYITVVKQVHLQVTYPDGSAEQETAGVAVYVAAGVCAAVLIWAPVVVLYFKLTNRGGAAAVWGVCVSSFPQSDPTATSAAAACGPGEDCSPESRDPVYHSLDSVQLESVYENLFTGNRCTR